MTSKEITKKAIDAAKVLIGPEVPYSKIGRERRGKLRRAIIVYLMEFYECGRMDERNEGKEKTMQLKELEPRWFTLSGLPADCVFHIGISFLCPQCKTQRLAVEFINPIDPANILAQMDCPPLGKNAKWTRIGDTFENLTLTPSIDASNCGHWHGHVNDGFIEITDGKCVVKA